ncbi:hypothetical protein PRABACTJOHN_01152 [Parabacteroides johnsonii DSM 18315]|uniref:Uncharacterized protein n=1 Tax=Parabacteroides johnsonii DSM 18315 TaxID=537006 RepID=B7B802_9BACT|nr:hypothetical protein PRABACTJOHN_01152 [Parabacteroides johnsonii DSM 18315]
MFISQYIGDCFRFFLPVAKIFGTVISGYLSKCHCYPMKNELVPHIFGISIAGNIF